MILALTSKNFQIVNNIRMNDIVQRADVGRYDIDSCTAAHALLLVVR